MKIRSFVLIPTLVLGLLGSARAAVETYEIDPAHSAVAFTVRHLVSKVPGSFTKFSGTIRFDRDHVEASSVTATIDAKSIHTANEKRDAHLRSADFFEAAKYDTLAFKSTNWKKTGEGTFDVAGDLTIHGVTKPVVLKAVLLGVGPGTQPGSQVSGWDVSTTINRRDFGVNGPTGLGRTVGDEVTISISVEAGLKK